MSLKYKMRRNHASKALSGHKNIVMKVICLFLLIGIVITGGLLFFYTRQEPEKVRSKETSTLVCYAAAQDIACGQKITKEMVKEVTIIPSMKEEYYAGLNCIGQYAAVTISTDMTLLQNMIEIQEINEQEREVECQVISLNKNLTENDRVDVRIMLPNGEDYIVLSKKGVHGISNEDKDKKLCYLWMTEDEILYYSAAIVDAYLYPGTVLYTTKYIQPKVQTPSVVTYVPSLSTMTMMKENPNILREAVSYMKGEDRKQLENRLTDYLNKDIRTMSWDEEANQDNSKDDSEEISAFVEDETKSDKEEP